MTATLEREASAPVPTLTHRVVRTWRATRLGMPVWAVLVVALLVLAASSINLSGYPESFDDEGTYVAQAWAAQFGELSHYVYWYDHPPVGWLQLAALMLPIGVFEWASSGVLAGRLVMLVFHVVSALLVMGVARRSGLSRTWSLVAVALFTLSPLAVHYQRMVLLDNIAVTWLLASLWWLRSPRRSLSVVVLAALAFSVAVLSKETFAVLAPVLLYEVWTRTHPSLRRHALILFVGVVGLVVAFYPLMAVLKGELLPGVGHVSLWDAIMWQLVERPAGDNRALVVAWMQLDAWLLVGGMLAIPLAAVRKENRTAVLSLVVLAVVGARTSYLPAPYAIGLLPFAALCLVAAGDQLRRWTRNHAESRTLRRTARVAGLAGLTAMAAAAVPLTVAWAPALHDQFTNDHNAHYAEAAAWLAENVGPDDDVLLDNSLWMDLVLAGHPREQTVWFYKIDLDPGVKQAFPGGHADFEWVVASPIMVGSAPTLPMTQAAIDASEVVVEFGPIHVRRQDTRPPAASAVRQ